MADDALLTTTDGAVDQSAVVSASRLRDGTLLWERHLPAEHCPTVATARGVAVLDVGALSPGAHTVGLQLSLRNSTSGPVMHGHGRYFAVVADRPDSELDCLALVDLREARVLYRRDIDLRPVGTPAVTSAGRLVCTLAPTIGAAE